MYNAYGDWEVSSDPSSWLFAGRWDQLASMKCVKRNCHKRPEPEGQTDQPSPPVDYKTDSAKNDDDADESPTVSLPKVLDLNSLTKFWKENLFVFFFYLDDRKP